MHKNAACEAAQAACESIISFSKQLLESACSERTVDDTESVSGGVKEPACNYIVPGTGETYPLKDDALYPRHHSFPKYAYFAERYNPQAIFWEKFNLAMSDLQRPTPQEPLPIVNSICNVYLHVRDLVKRITRDKELQVYFKGLLNCHTPHYPSLLHLQAEQLVLVKEFFTIMSQLPLAIIREDLPAQITIYLALVDVISSYKALLNFNYNIREDCLS